MAQNPWDAAPIVSRPPRDTRQNEREQAETRYRNTTGDTNPLARPPILPGEEGYTTEGEYLPDAGVVVARRGDWDAAPVASPSQLAAEAEAQRRVAGSEALSSGGQAIMQGLSLGWADELAGLIAGAGQGVSNAIRTAQGQPIEIGAGDLRNAVTNATREESERFSRERPVSNFALQALGGLLTGGGAIGTGVRGAVATGAAYGAGYGAGTGEGDTERLPGAVTGAVAGAATGGALAGVAQVAAPYAQRLAGIAGRITGQRGDPEVVAAERIVRQMARSGRTGREINDEISAFRSAGLEPSIIDIGGENLRATVRAAASGEGRGRQLATDYLEGVQASVGPRTIERARRLTPGEDRDSITLAGDLTAARRTEADQLYGNAYNQEIEVPVEVIRTLRGEEGAAAIAEARRIAALENDDAAVAALDALSVADLDARPVATGKALEYVRAAYADAAANAEGRLASAFQGRVDVLDSGLDAIPELREARQAYSLASQQIDAVGGVPDRLGVQRLGRPNRRPQNALTTNSDRYAAYVEGLPPEAQAANQVYQRDRIIESLGHAREGAVGPLNALRAGSSLPAGPNAPIVARNLEATFPGQGQQFQQDINLAREQVSNAAFVAPNTGAKSANVLIDTAAEGMQTAANVATGGKAAVIRLAVENAIRRVGLNEAEREAIVSLGIGSADELQRIAALAQQARSAGRPPPRAVRAFVDRSRNTLGAQSPVALQIERLLLPSRVAAEEEQQ